MKDDIRHDKRPPPGREQSSSFPEEVLKCSSDGIIVIAPDGTVRFANPALLNMFGYQPGELLTDRQWLEEGVPDPALREQILGSWQHDLKMANPPDRISPVSTKDGRRLWCRFHLSKMASGDVILSIQDITRQKFASERYHLMFQHAVDAILLVDAVTMEILDFNHRACEMLGYTAEEFARFSLQDIAGDRKPDEIRTLAKTIVSRGSYTFEGRIRRKDGSLVTVNTTAHAMRIAGRDYIQGVLRDITVEKQTALALKESEEKFRTLAEESPNMIFINTGGRVVYANKKCVETMGYTREELCSPGFSFMSLVAPEYHESTRKYFQQHARGQEVPSYEYAVVARTGKRIPSVISTKLISYEGKPAILGIVTDMSGLKQAEEDLRDLAAKLRAQKKVLEQKNIALKEVLAQIEAERLDIRRQVTANAERLLLPALARIKAKAGSLDRRHIETLESGLRDLASRFGARLTEGAGSLSPRELEAAGMIKSGLSTKEIAQLLGVSLRTVDTLRNRIRKKLGISRKAVNLVTHLQSMR